MEAEGDAKPGARKKGPYLMQLILISFPEAYKTSTIVGQQFYATLSTVVHSRIDLHIFVGMFVQNRATVVKTAFLKGLVGVIQLKQGIPTGLC